METISQPKTLVEQTYDAILEAICTGEILPGDRLNQDDLAARLNVSRQPVNSAISILKANGLVQDTGRRGSVVAELNPAALLDLYDFRVVIEPFAVNLAAERVTKAAAEQGGAIMRAGEKALRDQDIRALVQADAEFHQMIYRWSGNHVIESSMQINWHHIRRAMVSVLKEPETARSSWEAHAAILAAILAKEAQKAAEIMRRHIDDARTRTVRALAVSQG